MEWLSSNWLLLVLGIGALAFFAFGRGGCGMGHRGHDHNRQPEGGDRYDRDRETTTAPGAEKVESGDRPLASPGHAHSAPSVNQDEPVLEHAGHESNAGRRHRHGC